MNEVEIKGIVEDIIKKVIVLFRIDDLKDNVWGKSIGKGSARRNLRWNL